MLLDKTIPVGYIINKIRTEFFYVFITGLVVAYITRRFIHLIPEIPYAIPTFLGTAISVILSFKLSQSYDRWWEARKIWGGIVNDSRNLVLQLVAFVPAESMPAIRRIGHAQIAWCYCLGRSLRGLDPITDLDKYMSPDDLSPVRGHSNKPLAILSLISRELKALHDQQKLDTFHHIELNNKIVALTNWMGMAERIKTTVFPITYRLFLHLIIYVFLIALAVSLRGLESYFEIPILLVVGSFFFLIEKTATHLQDPFSNRPTDTPVTAIARNIEINIKQLLNETDIPEPVAPTKFYLS